MKPDEINKAIAGHLGWISKKVPSDEDVAKQGYDEFRHTWWYSPIGELASIPDFCSDLNVMHSAEMALSEIQIERYVWWINHLHPSADIHYSEIEKDIRREVFSLVHATACLKAESFLRTVGKWKEAE